MRAGKIVVLIAVFLLLIEVLISSFNLGEAKARITVGDDDGVEYLPMTISEDLTMLENCTATLTIAFDLPESRLARLYRENLGAVDTSSPGEIIPIPENRSSADEPSCPIPVREDFIQSIIRQQLDSFGLEAEILNSTMMPRGDYGEFKIWLDGNSVLPLSSIVHTNSSDTLRVAVGPPSAETFAGNTFSDVRVVQMMLTSIPGPQVFMCHRIVRFTIPGGSTLLNADELSPKIWELNLGKGTYITAQLSSNEISTISLDETTVISEEQISTGTEELQHSFENFMKFNIDILKQNLKGDYPSSIDLPCINDWSYEKEFSQTYTIPVFRLDYSNDSDSVSIELHVLVEASLRLDVKWHVAWDFSWFYGLTLFESWIQFTPTVGLSFDANASVAYEPPPKIIPLYNAPPMRYTAWFLVVPVEMTVHFDVMGKITFTAFGRIHVDAAASVSKDFKAGIRWTRSYGWEPIWSTGPVIYGIEGPNIDAEAGISLRAGLICRLSVLFYEVAGPFIEFEPYAFASANIRWTLSQGFHGRWELSANLRIAAGVTFAGWLKWLIGLSDWSVTLLDRPIWIWNGTYPEGAQLENDPPFAPGTPMPDVSTSTTGNITWSWTVPPESNGTITQYHVQVGTEPGQNDTFDSYPGGELNITVACLLGNRTYFAQVQAENDAGWGDWSNASDGVKVDTPPTCVITQGPIGIVDPESFFSFNWTGTDDVTSATELAYSYFLEGRDSEWSQWSSATNATYLDLPVGNYTLMVKTRDQLGSVQSSPTTRSFMTYKSTYLCPDTINLSHRGGLISVHIELPNGYDVSNINVSSIMIDSNLTIDSFAPPEIGDLDNDSLSELTVYFNRTDISEHIQTLGIRYGNVTLEITGMLNDAMPFEGKSIVRVRMAGDSNIDGLVNMKDIGLTAKAFGAYPTHPKWDSLVDENEDGKINLFDIALIAKNFGKDYR